MRRLAAYVGRYAGLLLIIAISATCGFVIGAGLASTPP